MVVTLIFIGLLRSRCYAVAGAASCASFYPRQQFLQGRKEMRPRRLGALVGSPLIRPEAGLLDAQHGPAGRRGECERDDTFETESLPGVGERLVRLDFEDL